jgi:SRSO17 transposase
LYQALEATLTRLHLRELGSPTLRALVVLYVTGLVLLDVRPTQIRITDVLPARCHDALNRLLRVMPLSTRQVMRMLGRLVQRLPQSGYLCLDDVVIEKAYARRLPWAAWTYSFAKKRKVYGLHIIVVLWCSDDGRWRIPVGFRVWRPKRSSAPHRYQTKPALALTLLHEVITEDVPFTFIAFDTHYTTGKNTQALTRAGVTWHGTLSPRTVVFWRGQRLAVRDLAPRLKLRWRKRVQVRAMALTVATQSYGTIRLCVVRNRHGNWEFLASNLRSADSTLLVQRKRQRWSIETLFRDTKQYAALEACQCWCNQAFVRHVALVLLAFVALQRLRQRPDECVSQVKHRWQLAVIQQGERRPAPLNACPPDLRSTA